MKPIEPPDLFIGFPFTFGTDQSDVPGDEIPWIAALKHPDANSFRVQPFILDLSINLLLPTFIWVILQRRK